MMLRLALEDEGYDVEEAADAESALISVRKNGAPDVMLVDLTLGVVDGSSYIRRVRNDEDVPIIVVSDRGDTQDVVAAFEAGADDYVTKPFEIKEITARIRALRRRTATKARGGKGSGIVLDSDGPLVLSPLSGTLRKADEDIHLTVTEFRLLSELAETPGRVLSRPALLRRIWDRGFYGDDRIVDVHIRRLRTKIEKNPSAPRIVVTVRGLGYRLDVA